MNITYCDLCGVALKEHDYYLLFIESPKRTNDSPITSANDYINKIRESTKEICPRCKAIHDRIFELRLNKLSQLVIDIKNNYAKPTRTPPHEKKKREKKK